MAKTIIGISGSLRRGSLNSGLLAAAAELAPTSLKIEVATIRGIPLYDGDVEEKDGIPQAVAELKDRIAAADGLLLASPEYNASIPGVLKNAIDWLSRPSKDIPRVFGNKPVGVIGATPGPGGTRLAQTAWLPVFRLLNMSPYFGKSVFLNGAGQAFDAEGRLTDEKLQGVVRQYMSGLAEFLG
jgi:NAD(P)H-dependent FMN reductase